MGLGAADLNEYSVRIYLDIVSNYEEFCELHQSVVELEQIIRENSRRAGDLEGPGKVEMEDLLNSNSENYDIKIQLQDAITTNITQKEVLADLYQKA